MVKVVERPLKQRDMEIYFLHKNKVSIVGLLETKVKLLSSKTVSILMLKVGNI